MAHAELLPRRPLGRLVSGRAEFPMNPVAPAMRVAPLVFLGLALVCEGFSYWGLNTVSGRRSFDEMAGMIPLVACPIGALLGVVALVVWWRFRPRA